MDDVFKGWRRKCGIVILLAAFFVAGAWVKSTVDQVVLRGSLENQPYSLPLAGRIGVISSTNPIESSEFVPQSNWWVTGLYTDAKIMVSPEQVADRVIPATHSEGDVPTDESLIQATAIQSGASLIQSENSHVVAADFSSLDMVVDSDEAFDDTETITSQFRWCGFCFERWEAADGSRGTKALIPHWSIVIPLLSLSAVLIFGPRRATAKIADSALLSVRAREVAEGNVLRGFQGWRSKLGIASLLTSLVLIGGWVRSAFVSDVFNFGTQAQHLLVSGKDGISCRRDGEIDGSGTHHSTRTGPAHERLTFRPLGPKRLAETVEEFSVVEPEESLSLTAATETVGDSSPRTNSQVVINTDWVGTDFEWGGMYISRGLKNTTVVVPYGFLVIPLVLLSAVCLVVRCDLRPEVCSKTKSSFPLVMGSKL